MDIPTCTLPSIFQHASSISRSSTKLSCRCSTKPGYPPEALELEITESVLVQHNEENVELLKRLSATGMQLSLDDFGTGYSSLSYLHRYPFDMLKIDRSFVSGIGEDANHTAIVRAIIAMARSLRLKVIAEGVESESQVAFLKAHGCSTVQGYYYSEPVPAGDFADLLREAPIWSATPWHRWLSSSYRVERRERSCTPI
jgi:EAL domain-containing protein (putative c-di-GMP-specific phosphodiesterase class I)